jgi:glycine cleavage system H protein
VSASSDIGEVPQELLYTNDHEWLRLDGGEGVIGVTFFAQEQLGDIVYLDLPDAGAIIRVGKRFGEVESVKTVSDLFAPVSGEVIEANELLIERPELVNSEPYGGGWLLRVRITTEADLEGLLSAEVYQRLLPDL